jgi:hypothetical protein
MTEFENAYLFTNSAAESPSVAPWRPPVGSRLQGRDHQGPKLRSSRETAPATSMRRPQPRVRFSKCIPKATSPAFRRTQATKAAIDFVWDFVLRNVSQPQHPRVSRGVRSIGWRQDFARGLRSRSANSNSALHPQAPTATARWRCDPGASAALSQAKAYSRGMHLGRPLPRRRVRRLKGCPLIAPTGSRSPAPRLRSFQETAPARSTRRLPQQRHEP